MTYRERDIPASLAPLLTSSCSPLVSRTRISFGYFFGLPLVLFRAGRYSLHSRPRECVSRPNLSDSTLISVRFINSNLRVSVGAIQAMNGGVKSAFRDGCVRMNGRIVVEVGRQLALKSDGMAAACDRESGAEPRRMRARAVNSLGLPGAVRRTVATSKK